MTDTIQVPRVWLERLVKLANDVEKSKYYKSVGSEAIGLIILTGYASSAETLLTNGEKE